MVDTVAFEDRDLGDGLAFWQEFTANAQGYYVLPSEVQLIDENADWIAGIAREGLREGEPLIVAELGSGGETALGLKTSRVIEAVDPDAYVGVDESRDVLGTAKAFLARRFPDLPFSELHQDFNEQAMVLPRGGKRLMVQFGSTISNLAGSPADGLPFRKLVSVLKNFRAALDVGDDLIIGYDSNQDGPTAIGAYEDPNHAAFSMNLLDVMARDPAIEGLDRNDFFYRPTWHDAAKLVTHDLVAKRDGGLFVAREPMPYEAGDAHNYSNSYKYPVWVFEAAARMARLEPRDRRMDSQNRMGLHALRAC